MSQIEAIRCDACGEDIYSYDVNRPGLQIQAGALQFDLCKECTTIIVKNLPKLEELLGLLVTH